MKQIGPHSRPGKLATIDGRRAEARLMRDIKADLVKHCGGTPSAVQCMLIEQAAMLSLRLHLMDRAALSGDGVMSERNGRQYLTWANSLARLLRQLGLTAPPPPTPQKSHVGFYES